MKSLFGCAGNTVVRVPGEVRATAFLFGLSPFNFSMAYCADCFSQRERVTLLTGLMAIVIGCSGGLF